MSKYNSTANNVITERQAARSPRVADVAALFVLSVCAVVLFCAVGLILALISSNWAWLKWMAGIGGAVGLVLYLGGTWEYKSILWSVESHFGIDIDKDSRVGPPPDPGTVVIDGRRVSDSRAAERKRADILRFVNIVYSLQQMNRPVGQKAMRGRHLIHQDVSDEFHADVGTQLVNAGFAERSGTGWRLTATPDEVEAALGTW